MASFEPDLDPEHTQPDEIYRWGELAKQGHKGFQFVYAYAHYRGIIVAQDYELARKWFTAAAQQGHVKSSFFLGAMHERGWGGEQDFSKAASLYLTAATANYMPAQHNLGRAYQEGQGVPKNLVEAHFWLSVAAQNGGENSQKVVKEFETQMTTQEIELANQKLEDWSVKKATAELNPILVSGGSDE